MKRKHCEVDDIHLLLEIHKFIIDNIGKCTMVVTTNHHVYLSDDGMNISHKRQRQRYNGRMQISIKFDSVHSVRVPSYIKKRLLDITAECDCEVLIH